MQAINLQIPALLHNQILPRQLLKDLIVQEEFFLEMTDHQKIIIITDYFFFVGSSLVLNDAVKWQIFLIQLFCLLLSFRLS